MLNDEQIYSNDVLNRNLIFELVYLTISMKVLYLHIAINNSRYKL